MGEVDAQVAKLSDTEIVIEFRNALVALYPILRKLSCLEDDTQPYDDFDAAMESLWEVLVARSLMWKHGWDNVPKLPPYGFAEYTGEVSGYIEARAQDSDESWRFVQFMGDRRFGSDPFNVAQGVNLKSGEESRAFWSEVSFRYVQL